MKQHNLSRLKCLSVLFVLFTASFLVLSPTLAQGPPLDSPDFVPGEILVKFKAGASPEGKRQRLAEVRGSVVRSVERLEILQVKVPAGQEQALIERLRAQGDVAFASLNYRVYALETPNDPGYNLQWAFEKIEAPDAWDTTTGSNSVIIAVIDTGVDLDHPDLQANLIAGHDYVNFDDLPDDDSFNGHGTHVAGIVAAVGNNGLGVTGMNWQAKIMPLKILDASGNGNTFTLTEAIVDAADGGAQVINLSLGGNCSGNDWAPVQEAVNYATLHGALVIAASGNYYSSSVFCPGALDKVMAVGATNINDIRSDFSNYGTQLDIVAPGEGIYSTVPGGGYDYKNGTSMATPLVSGLAGLIWSLNPDLSPETVRQAIQSTAEDLGPPGWDIEYGHGRINAKRAVVKLYNLNLTYANGQEITAPVSFLVDDNPPFPLLPQQIYISTDSPQPISWTASMSPNVSWLTIAPPTNGQVSASATAQLTLSVVPPATYGTHTTTILVTGTTPGGLQIDPKTIQVQLTYMPELQRLIFPIIMKAGTTP